MTINLPWLEPGDPFPSPERALRRPNGLLAAGGDLSLARLVEAYSCGIFPWSSEDDPLLWWSPDPRMVLFVRELHVSRSLRRTARARTFTVTADQEFAGVMAGCAAPRRGEPGTWITDDMREAYLAFHHAGYAHSIETWRGDTLVGGLYGVAIGRMFFGESMFAREPDASKVAIVHLIRQLEHWGFELIDCQMSTPHLASLGAREIPRRQFLADVARLAALPAVASPWRLGDDIAGTIA